MSGCVKLYSCKSIMYHGNPVKMCFVHSKLRNSLSTETAEKLVYIKTSYPTIADCLHVSDSEGISANKRSLKLGHVIKSTRPSATALPGS
jgi:hypothetical protein